MLNNEELSQNFYNYLENNEYKGKIVSAKYIPYLQNRFKEFQEQKLLDIEFYEEFKTYFEFQPDVDFDEINSLFVMAIPQPQYEAIFHWKNRKISLLIPPMYLYGLKVINQMNDVLSKLLNPAGYHVTHARLPQKTLAVSCGLATYGRNNITYVKGMGSFHRLSTFYSDFPCDQDSRRELQMMDLCEECSACVRKCPTGAIPTDRFLLRAEKCITYHNEHPGEIPFPDWIDPSWHNCLVGCLHCQKVCPANKQVKDWIEPGPIFNEEETKLLVSEKNIDLLPDETKKKIEDFDLKNYFEVLPRNLKVFF